MAAGEQSGSLARTPSANQRRRAVKSLLMCFIAMVFAALATPVRLAAQQHQDHNHKHHHYKLIDLGTLGGPQSFTQDQLQFLTKRGTVAGWADTSTPDPNYPTSCLFCIFGPFIFHAFQWKE